MHFSKLFFLPLLLFPALLLLSGAASPSLPPEEEKCDCKDSIFHGKARKIAKLTIAQADTQRYAALDELFPELPSDEEMAKLNICDDDTCDRRGAEMKNVRIAKAWILAVTRESDCDYHIIIGNAPSKEKSTKLLNVEISGIPSEEEDAAFKRSKAELEKARGQFAGYFKAKKKSSCFSGGYKKYYRTEKTPKPEKPVPISVCGSLFYDTEHDSPKQRVGPKDLKPNTAWEIHPVTAIEFLEKIPK